MRIKESATVIGIAILFALFIGLLMDALYEEPTYEEFCNRTEQSYPVYSKEPRECGFDYEQQQTIDSCYQEGGNPIFSWNLSGCQIYKSCSTCQKEFDEARRVYNRNVFMMLSPLAVISIILGMTLSFIVIGSGLMFGGILLLIYSTARYFSDMSKILRVLVVFAELLILVWIAWKKMEDRRSTEIKRK